MLKKTGTFKYLEDFRFVPGELPETLTFKFLEEIQVHNTKPPLSSQKTKRFLGLELIEQVHVRKRQGVLLSFDEQWLG